MSVARLGRLASAFDVDPFFSRVENIGLHQSGPALSLVGSKKRVLRLRQLLPVLSLLVAACASTHEAPRGTFTIAVIPDTQNYLDFRHQRASGFPIDAAQLFLDQMAFIEHGLRCKGGAIEFVTALGDVWQTRVDIGPSTGQPLPPPRTLSVSPNPNVASREVPIAEQGYARIAGKVPFAVVPGNHDYDWQWLSGGVRRVGGRVNFTALFGPSSPLFKNKNWYVASHDDGGDSAQRFNAGGYRFLHLGLQFEPSDASIAWARETIRHYPNIPVIVSTHAFIDNKGNRDGQAASSTPSEANPPQALWDKLIEEEDQIFLVLSGHYSGQAHRIDRNQRGHLVYQLLSDYQDRRQVSLDLGLAGPGGAPLGDGWLRLLEFDFAGETPSLAIQTYSTHYRAFSSELDRYSAWYKAREAPAASDAEFNARDAFRLPLSDFRERFGRPRRLPSTSPERCP